MACEDYPCCGHGPAPMGDGGGCPVRTRDGRERFRCVSCGKLMRAGAPSAICAACHKRAARRARYGDDDPYGMDGGNDY